MKQIPESYITNMELRGFVREKIDGNVDRWVLTMLENNENVIGGIRRANAGEPQIPYKGCLLEQNEFFGKHLTGLSFCYSLTARQDVLEAGNEMVAQLAAAQGKDGYVGVHYGDDRLDGSDFNWDLWGHYHTIYGLAEWYRRTGNETALQVAVKAADFCIDHFADRSYSYGWESVNYAIGHGYAVLHGITGEERYLREAVRLVRDYWPLHGNWMNDALEGKELYQSELPRWEVLHAIMTLSALWESTGEQAYYDAFDAYYVKGSLAPMEKLFAGYVNARLDQYLSMLQD
jgi:DUF1680 family protein